MSPRSALRSLWGPLLSIRRAPALLLKREEGQAAIEFLLIIPTYIIFLLITVDFGMLTYEYVSVANAAREGARYAATICPHTPPPPAGCTAALVQNRTVARSGGILKTTSDVTVGWIDMDGDSDQGSQGDSVVVFVKHTYNFLFLPVGPGIPVWSCADMRLEQTDPASLVAPGLPVGTPC